MTGKNPCALLTDIDDPGGRFSIHRQSVPPDDSRSPARHQPASDAAALDKNAYRVHRKMFCTHSSLIARPFLIAGSGGVEPKFTADLLAESIVLSGTNTPAAAVFSLVPSGTKLSVMS
ncbi:MAG: hypothetical protein JO085_05490 [Acidimicrobiia bacterium]|nr:hypothetical protein [Acidimicrobiia bacterium]